MEFVKGNPYFCESNEKMKSYPYLNKDITTDILIIGGGVDGAIANYYLSQDYDTCLIDKSRFGYMCTSCATALLEYQLDEFSEDLLGKLSEEEIVNVYKMGQNSVDKLRSLSDELGNTFHFAERPTFLYSNKCRDVEPFIKEYEFRKSNGFKVDIIDPNNNPFDFSIKAGVYAPDGGAELSPYLFSKRLIEEANNQDKIFENTEVSHYVKIAKGYIVKTNFGETIRADKIIFATGLDWSLFSKKPLFKRYTSYSIVTEPISELEIYNNALIHDYGFPYHYMRKLQGGSLIYGGKDTYLNEKMNERLAEKKYQSLLSSLKQMFPKYSDKIKIAYKFCGAFGITDNNLGLIGKSHDPNVLYFLSCGANGIINALFGVDLLNDIFNNKINPLERAFSPLR